jgi:DNA-binding NtrC family response regulator
LSNEIILIVNDDDISSLFADALQIEGFKTIKSNNASLALEKMKLRPNEFAAVLVDKTSETGDLATNVKSINTGTKVILTSGYSYLDFDISHSNYDRFIQLPVRIDKLTSTVREVLVE